VVDVPPSPKFQEYVDIFPVEVEVKSTFKGALPEVLSQVKLATGGSSFLQDVQEVNT
jgi:hypothetical protein